MGRGPRGEKAVGSAKRLLYGPRPMGLGPKPRETAESYRYVAKGLRSLSLLRGQRFDLKEVNWRKLSYTYLNPEHPIVPKLSSGIGQDVYGDFIFKKLKKGAFTGNLLHSIFENIAFNDRYHWDKIVKRSLKRLALVNQ